MNKLQKIIFLLTIVTIVSKINTENHMNSKAKSIKSSQSFLRNRVLEESETVPVAQELVDSDDQLDAAKGRKGQKGDKKKPQCKCGPKKGKDGKPPKKNQNDQISSNDNSRILEEEAEFVYEDTEDLASDQELNDQGDVKTQKVKGDFKNKQQKGKGDYEGKSQKGKGDYEGKPQKGKSQKGKGDYDYSEDCDCLEQDGDYSKKGIESSRKSGGSSGKDEPEKQKKGKMMMFVIGGIVVLIAVFICIACYCYKNRKSNTNVVDNRSPRDNNSNSYFCCKKKTVQTNTTAKDIDIEQPQEIVQENQPEAIQFEEQYKGKAVVLGKPLEPENIFVLDKKVTEEFSDKKEHAKLKIPEENC